MTREEMREKVAKAMCDAVNVEGTWEETGTLHREKVWFVSADAAIAIIRGETLEEAAKTAEAFPARTHGNLATAPYAAAEQAADEIAAAIRALKDQATT